MDDEIRRIHREWIRRCQEEEERIAEERMDQVIYFCVGVILALVWLLFLRWLEQKGVVI